MLSDHVHVIIMCNIFCANCGVRREDEFNEEETRPVIEFMKDLQEEDWGEIDGRPFCGDCLSLEKE